MAAILVTLAQAKTHLRITTAALDPGDVDIQAKLDAAEATILNYIGSTLLWRTTAATWVAGTVPEYVKAAILLQLSELYRFRGDDLDGQGPVRAGEDLSPVVVALLRRSRDPVIA